MTRFGRFVTRFRWFVTRFCEPLQLVHPAPGSFVSTRRRVVLRSDVSTEYPSVPGSYVVPDIAQRAHRTIPEPLGFDLDAGPAYGSTTGQMSTTIRKRGTTRGVQPQSVLGCLVLAPVPSTRLRDERAGATRDAKVNAAR
eukprot:983067-Rhodomonas_salina.2